MPLAIVGLSCRLPGADDADEYWRLLIEARSAITNVPRERLDTEIFYDPKKGVLGKSYTRLGGVVRDRPFDQLSCPIPDELIHASDPSHLNMLEVAAAALRDARMDPFSLPTRNIGVYIGHSRGSALAGDLIYTTRVEEFAQTIKRLEPFDDFTAARRDDVASSLVKRVRDKFPHRAPNGDPDVTAQAAARLIAQAFGLRGSYQAIDAACASGLFSVAAAARALHRGHIDVAIAGSASYSSWFSLVLFSQAQALSAKGSFPFDHRADGFISSDGYGAVILKTLERAVADGDRIYSTIRGIGTSCDGRGRSLWAPRTEGQVTAFERAYAGVLDPSRLQYIEAHGTSTQLGDATEAESLRTALKRSGKNGSKIPIASVKGNIGHTCETAGIAGLIKTVLALHHRAIPPAINFEEPNRQIDWDAAPFFVPTKATEWDAPDGRQPRLAGVNSFGIGGLNAHVALEEYVNGGSTSVFFPAPDPQAARDSVAIVGMGAIFPAARTLEAFRTLVESKRKAISMVPPGRWDPAVFYSGEPGSLHRSPTRYGGFISDFTYDWRRHKIPPKQLEMADPLHFMLLDAADQALTSAGYADKSFDRTRTAVVIGTMLANDFFSDLSLALRVPEFEAELAALLAETGLDAQQADDVISEFRTAFKARNRTLLDETGGFSSSTLSSSVAKALDMMGGAFTIDAGEASSFAALAAAEDMLMTNSCDIVLCAGAQRYMGIDGYEWYGLRGLIAPEGGGNGKTHTAVVPGEGVGMLVLKRASDALRDGDRIWAHLKNVRGATDTVSIEAAVLSALEKSLANANGSSPTPHPVEVVMTGVPGLDAAAEAAIAAYGENGVAPFASRDVVSEQIGHAFGASGMASLIKAVLQMQNGAGANGKLTGVISCSHSGLAYHALLSPPNGDHPVAAGVLEDWRIVRFSAETAADLASQLSHASHDGEGLYQNSGAAVFRPASRHRAAIVAQSPESLRQKSRGAADAVLQQAAHQVLAKEGVFFGRGIAPPRVAFLFPGQGSQYSGMLRELIAASPAAAAKVREIDAVLARMRLPSFDAIVSRGNAELADDVWATQMSVLAADIVMYAAVLEQGIKPDVVVGHSFGEYPALFAAGVWDLEQALRITDARCRFIAASEGSIGMLMATEADPAIVETLRDGIEGVVGLANHNAPDQTVFGGEADAVAELDRRLTAAGYNNRRLPVPRPFHTSLMAPVQAPLREALAAEYLRPPVVPFLSSVTNRYVADPIDIRDNLVAQLTKPILYVDLVQRLHRDGFTAFVEIGPRQVLTNLHRRILPNAHELTLVASDHPKRPGIEQVLGVRAALECAGLNLPVPAMETPVNVPAHRIQANRAQFPIVHFDATERRRQNMRQLGEQSAVASKQPPPDSDVTLKEAPKDPIESFLIDFICEQTGYPPEIVQLDADLEADLGIDSLKKAQLFGEIRERFDISMQSTGRLALEDFPTLRHVLELLRPFAANQDLPAVRGHGGPAGDADPLVERAAEGTAAAGVTSLPDTDGDLDRSHPDAGPRMMTRFVLRAREVALPRRGIKPEWSGAAVVVGEEPTAVALRKRLSSLGAEVLELDMAGDVADVLDRFERRYRESPVTHLFLTLSREPAAACNGDDAAWRIRRERGVLLPYLLCQRWTRLVGESGLTDRATLTAVTGLGGDFGLSGNAAAAEGGALTGLLKSVRREFDGMLVKVIDAPVGDPPESIAASVCDEIAARSQEVEVGYVHGRRRILRAVPRAALPRPACDIARGSNWVVTGGARGITAIVARELGRRYDLRLHLVGTTPGHVDSEFLDMSPEQLQERKREMARRARAEGRNPVEDWTRLEKSFDVQRHRRELERIGVRAAYHQCDVANASELGRVLDEVRRVDGPIHGIIHGAGVELACRYESKQLQSVEVTLGAKVDGASALMSLTQDDPLEWFLAFGSVVGRFGGVGQTDYTMACDMLSKQVQHFRRHRSGCRSVLFAWPAWGETGMSVRPETRLAIEVGKLRFMPPLEGVEHVIDEIRAGAPEGEVIILDHARALDHEALMPSWHQRTAFLQAATTAVEMLPLIEAANEIEGERRMVVETHLNPGSDVFLIDHKFHGAPLLPSVIGMEALAEAARLLAGGGVVSDLHKVEILHPLRFSGVEPQRIEIEAVRRADGITTALSSAFLNRQHVVVDPRRVYVTAIVDVGSQAVPLDAPPLTSAVGEWYDVSYPDPDQAREENLIEHGASFRKLKQIAVDGNVGWGRIVAPPEHEIGGDGRGHWSLPAAVIDSCLVACAIHSRTRLGLKHLPSSFRHIRIGRLPDAGELCTVQFSLKELLADFVTYDFILYDAGAHPILVVDGHRSAILNTRGV